MKKIVVLIGLLIGCNANVIDSSVDGGSGGSNNSGSGGTGSGGTIISTNTQTDICFQKQGDCKFIKTCENGNITWEPDLLDVPLTHDLCVYFECQCSITDCYPIEHFESNGTACAASKICLNGVCK